MDKTTGMAKAVAHTIRLIKPKYIACNEYAYIDYMIEKAFDMGYMYRVYEENSVKTKNEYWR